MAVTAIKLSPEYPAPGQVVTISPVGSIPTNTDLRYYLLSAPPSSSLETLATYEANGKKLADIRLKVKENGQGTFTPDVPGQYKVIVRPVTTYDFIPSYGGEIPPYINPSNPDLGRRPSKADNEEGTFVDASGGVTAQVSDVPSRGESIVAYDVVTRAVGFSQDTSTLTLKCNTGAVLTSARVSTPVKLASPTTPRAAIAIYDPLVLQVLSTIEEESALSDMTNYSSLLLFMVDAFNEHIALDQWKVHTNADATNFLTSTADVTATASSLQTRMDDISGKYNAHRILTAGPVHVAADNTHATTTFTISSDDDVENAVRYYKHLLTKILNHAISYTPHDHSTETSVVDGYFSICVEPPSTMAEVAQAINGTTGTRWENYGLTDLYESHRQRVVITAHYGSGVGTDTVNSVRFLSGTTQNLIATANALADALTRHIRNQDANSQAATTPYHFEDANKTRIPVMRANDARSLALCIEELWLCLESHLWSGGPPNGFTDSSTAGSRGQHQGRVLGGALITGDDLPPLMVRLQKAYDRALGPLTSPPDGLVTLAAKLRKFVGFT